MIGIVDVDSILYRACWDIFELDEARDKYCDILRGYLDEGWCDEFACYIKGKDNWRYKVFSDYKAQRGKYVNERMNMEVMAELVDWIVDNRLAIPSHGCEADDLVRRKAEKMRARDKNFIVISADKDLDCIAGKHMRPTPKGELLEYMVSPEEANYNYYMQVLIGDMTDNIRSPKRLGPKTAEKILDTDPSNYKKVIEEAYKERCGNEWLHALMFTGSLIHIQRYQDDYFKWDGKNFWEHGFKENPSCYEYK